MNVPTVQQLLAQIDSWDGNGKSEEGNDSRMQDWEKTSLKPYVEYFRNHVNALMKDEGVEKKRGREEEGEGMEF